MRELAGLGIPEVTMVYRGVEDKMSGYAHEWKAAKQEGVPQQLAQSAHLAFEADPHNPAKVARVRCAVKLDDAKQPTGDETTIDADIVLLAIGQAKLEALLSGLSGVTFEKGPRRRGRVAEDHPRRGLGRGRLCQRRQGGRQRGGRRQGCGPSAIDAWLKGDK